MGKNQPSIFSVITMLLCQLPASAHVKWFLQRSEQDLLLQPKPALFTSLNTQNVAVVLLAGAALYAAYVFNKRMAGSAINTRLRPLCARWQSPLSLLIGVFAGTLLIKSAFDMNFMVPNLHLHPCCVWIAQAEAFIGIGLLLGFCTRACGAAMIFLLVWSFVKFSPGDCVDLAPMYGLALYALLAGRGRWSLDYALHISRDTDPFFQSCAFLCVRLALGFGLISLGLDEKIVNPQLALELLKHAPMLNFAHPLGMSNELFVLCSGTSEVVLGLMLLFGIFPRVVVCALLLLFVATTATFGMSEFIGHLPYYAMIIVIFLTGNATADLRSFIRKNLSISSGLNKHLVPLADLR